MQIIALHDKVERVHDYEIPNLQIHILTHNHAFQFYV